MDRNGLIGSDGELPWHIPEDLMLFKELTMDSVVVMGRKTYESIGKALPNRTNIVISRKAITDDKVIHVSSVPGALTLASEFHKDIYIIGGAYIYEQTIPYANRMYISHVIGDYQGDTFFPEYDESYWEEIREEKFEEFNFKCYRKIAK